MSQVPAFKEFPTMQREQGVVLTLPMEPPRRREVPRSLLEREVVLVTGRPEDRGVKGVSSSQG